MPLLHLITGPPFGAPFWDAVAERLTVHPGLRPAALDVLGLPAPATVEALACGTPVIAWRNGSTPEVIRHGINGFLVDSLEEAIAAVGALERLDRARVRSHFEVSFSVSRQAEDYEQLYRHQIQRR